MPVLRLHGIPAVAIGGPRNSHKWTNGGTPVVHPCSPPFLDITIDRPSAVIDEKENLKSDLCVQNPIFLPLHDCRSISAKPTGIQKERDITRLPEN